MLTMGPGMRLTWTIVTWTDMAMMNCHERHVKMTSDGDDCDELATWCASGGSSTWQGSEADWQLNTSWTAVGFDRN